MKSVYKILFIALGFLLSINQGVSIIVGHLRTGALIGSDIFMPLDIPLFLLLFLAKDKSAQTRYGLASFLLKLLVLVFYILAFTGEFLAYDNGEFRFQIVHLSRALMIFYVISSRLHDKEYLKDFAIGTIAGLAFQSFVGFWQWQVGSIYIPYLKTSSGYRVTGTFAVPNAYGTYLAALLPLSIRFAFFTNIKPKIVWIIISILGLGSLYATYTRGAWLAFVISMFIFSFFDLNSRKIKRTQKIIYVTFGILFFVFMGIKYGDNIIHRMSGSAHSLSSDAKQSRVSLAKDAWRIIQENKVFGVGLNNYRHHADQSTQGLRMVHNAYLLIGAEQGLIALFLFIIVHLAVLVAGMKLLKSKDKLIYNVGSATLAGYVAILICHMVGPDYRMVGVIIQHWRLLGLIIALLVMDDLENKRIYKMQQYLRAKKMAAVANNYGDSTAIPAPENFHSNGNGNGYHNSNNNITD